MAQFIGKWIEDRNSIKNYDEFCRAAGSTHTLYIHDGKIKFRNLKTDEIKKLLHIGIPDDMIDKHRDATSVLEYEQDGDNWILQMTYSGLPTKTFKFQPGKELETTGFYDDVLKLMVIFESDSKCVVLEKSEMMGYKPLTVTREVKGDMMFTTIEISGVKMTSEFKRG